MKKFGLKSLIPVGISLLTFAGFVGSISGSLAWWAYSTRVSASYQGTSVTTSEQLQIGFKLDVTKFDTAAKVKALTDLGLVEDTPEGETNYRYVFAKAGGGLSALEIKTYLEQEGTYAIDELVPVTSRTYATGQEFTLYESLIAGNEKNTEIALESKYVHIPFVFRILKLNAVNNNDSYAGGRLIYLSKVIADADSDNPNSTIANGLRIHFDNGTDSFILNPSDTSTNDTGKTNVCGLLSIGGVKGYYDVDSTGTEILYGDYTGSKPATSVQAVAPTSMSDVNGTGADSATLADMSKTTTFLAAHRQGATIYPSLEDVNTEGGFKKGTQEYKTMHAIAPDSSTAVLSGGQPLCETAESGNHLAELDAVIWLEGWDHSVIDTQASHKFNLGLQFQIDLVS